ncbi:hypothetical protein [Halomarina oriensis]|uniref:Uncharacterized protein n=1 Tax=Halomarina oriensis TaxID=671145 RepID=A0A6B0GN75_9EURY|nr:hypothetical protein [Halomarina oriensis]MWG36234.1 hypothetical protein [Halomarina oriensis]
MSDTYLRVVVGLAAIAFLPAIIAGAGFYIAAALAVAVVASLLGGRFAVRTGTRAWENRHMGAKSRRTDIQDVIGGSNRKQNKGGSNDQWGRR